MSTTPRTDAFLDSLVSHSPYEIAFARTLEAELQACHAVMEELESEYRKLSKVCTSQGIQLMHVADLEEAVKTLRGALKNIAKPALGGKQQQWMAKEALESTKSFA